MAGEDPAKKQKLHPVMILGTVGGRMPFASKPQEGFKLRTHDELHDGGHVHYFTFSMLDRLFERYGYSEVKRFGIGRFGRLHNLQPTLLSGSCHVVAKK